MLPFDLCGERLQALASGALYWPAQRMLLVADAHLGKAQSFRRLGVPVPQASTQGSLAQISTDLHATGARHIVFLGDLLHSARSQGAQTQADMRAWREQHSTLQCTLIRGNHDDRAGDPPAELNFDVVDEPLVIGPFALCHHPETRSQGYVLAGHWHPCITLAGKAKTRLRLPCFWLGDERTRRVGVMPAYGEFTGMHPINQQPGDRVIVIAGDAVRAL
jgi:DNA ligase-associated metallophosphoesterase